MLTIFYFLRVIVSFYSTSFSQTGPPATDIYIADLKIKKRVIEVGSLLNITNRNGYDNQPMFLPDGTGLLYTSIREDGQADTYQYNLLDKSTARITPTKESEYSPTIMPDGRHFSTVRVEADSSQRLWKFPLQGGKPSLILEHLKPVGYHAWGNENTVALFVLGSPNSLHIADVRTGKSEKIIGNIGRSLHKIPGREAISFVHKVAENEWWIKLLGLKNNQITPLILTLAGSEDYTWTPGGIALMAQKSKLYQWNPGSDKNWLVVADLKEAGLSEITRMAVSPRGDKLALVSRRSLSAPFQN